MQFLTSRKDGQSLEALGHGFYCSITKQSLQKQCKNYPKIHGQTRGAVAQSPPPPEYATARQLWPLSGNVLGKQTASYFNTQQ